MDWLQITQTLGVSVCCLFGLAYGVWKSAQYLADKVLNPLVAAHIDFLKSTIVELRKSTIISEAHAKAMEKISEAQSEIIRDLRNGRGK